MIVAAIIYVIAGYWALNKIWWSRHVYLYSDTGQFYFSRVFYAILFGWAAIPIALIMALLGK